MDPNLTALLNSFPARGITARVDGDHLRISPRNKLAPEETAMIAEHKAEILAMLNGVEAPEVPGETSTTKPAQPCESDVIKGVVIRLNVIANQLTLERFTRACERWGTAYEGGCFCSFLGFQNLGGALRHYRRICCYSCRLTTDCDTFDHATTFKRGGVVTAVVGQPYVSRERLETGGDLAQYQEFCRRSGLNLEVSAESWHLPGRTLALIFTTADSLSLSLNASELPPNIGFGPLVDLYDPQAAVWTARVTER